MEVTGFAIALIAEARALAISIKTRIVNYRKGMGTFRALRGDMDRLAHDFGEVEKLIAKFPTAVPVEVSCIFNQTLVAVRSSLVDADQTIDHSFSKVFESSGSGTLSKLKSKAFRTMRANAITNKMCTLELRLKDASSQLLHLISVLANALKIQEQQSIIVPKLDNLAELTREKQERVSPILRSETTACDVREVYLRRTSTPALTHTVNLDFDAKDEHGNAATPEAMLKESVLHSDSPATITSATGVINPAYGVVGMAGVGKTVALQGLAYDKDIQNRFPDGSHYIVLGQGATVQTAIRELVKVMRVTGATTIIDSVKTSCSLREAVDFAVTWFHDKICLFLVDDLWPTESCSVGFLNDLRQLLRGCASSRMAVSTRSVAIAHCAGKIVNFGNRDPSGPISVKIFLAHADGMNIRKCPFTSLSDSMAKILSMCGGLPIALSITGCAISLLSKRHGSFEKACEVYAMQLEKKRAILAEEAPMDGTSLNTGMRLSLQYLEAEYTKLKAQNSCNLKAPISNLYTSFCVFRSQSWVSIDVLCRLWKVGKDFAQDIVNLFCGMCLATIDITKENSASGEEARIVLHDCQLVFCCRQAEKLDILSAWHAELLNGYIHDSLITPRASHCPNLNFLGIESVLGFTPRTWWSTKVPDDGYIHANLAMHLSSAKLHVELAATLLDARWTILRTKIGGISALKSDYDYLISFLRSRELQEQNERPSENSRKSFEQIIQAVQLSWGRVSEGLRTFQFQLCGRLFPLRGNSVVDAYLKSFEVHTPTPYLLPMTSFFPDLGNARKMEIPVDGLCTSIACSPCGRFVVAGGFNVTIVEISTGKILDRLEGGGRIIHCVSISETSREVFAGLRDGSVLIWDWASSNRSERILEGHESCVNGIVACSYNSRLYSVSDDRTVRVWDYLSGTQLDMSIQSSGVNCIDITADGEIIALGLHSGTLLVLNAYSKEILYEDPMAHNEPISTVAFNFKEEYLATGSWDGTVQLWDTLTWLKLGLPLKGHKHFVTGVSFSSDGRHIASSSEDGTVRVWEVVSGKCCAVSPTQPTKVQSIAFNCRSNSIVTGMSDGILRVWDTLLNVKSNSSQARVLGVSNGQNGLLVASALPDGTLILLDADKRVTNRSKNGEQAVFCVSFRPDGLQMICGLADGSLALWDTRAFIPIGSPWLGHEDSVRSVAFSLDGQRVVSGSDDNTVRLWNSNTGRQIGGVIPVQIGLFLDVAESCSGDFVVSQEYPPRPAIIWSRYSREVVWTSKPGKPSRNQITDKEALEIIRSCGQVTRQSSRDSSLSCEDIYVYSNLHGDILGHLPADVVDWQYFKSEKILTASLLNGENAVCKLISSLT